MKRKFIWLFLTVVAIFAATSLALATSWSTGQFNFQRTGYNPSSSIDQARLTTVWSYAHPSHYIYRGFPTEYKGMVFMCFTSFTAAPNVVQAIDINTGALLWSNNLASTGSALRGTPTAATIDTTGSGDFGDFVYVAKGSAAGGAGIRCIDAATGLTRWDAGGGLGTVRCSEPALADTNGDFDPDIVIWGTESGNLVAANPVNGVIAWSTTLDANYGIFYSPSLSTDNKVAYAGTYDVIGATGHGRVHAVNTTTGAIINSFDPLVSPIAADFGFPWAPIYVDDNTVLAMGYDVAQPGYLGPQLLGKPVILDRNVNYLAHTLPGSNYRESGAAYFQGAVYPDPLSADTLFIYSIENGFSFLGSPIMARAWNIPAIRTMTANPRKWNYAACTPVAILGEGPVAVANSPDGFGATLVNSDGNFASADARLYVLPNKTTPWGGGTTNFDYWNKPYLASQSIGFRNNTGNLTTDGVNDSGIVAVLSEGYGFLHGMRNSSTARARWVDETFCYAGMMLNVSLPLNGTDTDTETFYNIGDAAGSYSISATPFAASHQGNTFAKVELKARLTSSLREALSDDVVRAMTATSKGMFLRKTTSMMQLDAMDDQFPGISQKSAYTSKTREMATSAGIPVWLTITDLTGGGPVLPGGSADIELVASSATLGLGTYFADLHLTVTPDEPDPDFYGGTDVVIPITFVVGFLKNEADIVASDVSLVITNVGQLGNFEHGDGGVGAFQTSFPTATGDEFFAGSIVIDMDTTCIFWHNNDTTGLYLPDQDIVKDSVLPGSLPLNTPLASAYIAQVNACTTAFITNSALPGKNCCSLRVELMTFGIWDGAFCDTSIVLKYVITNVGNNTVTGLNIGQWCDWDQSPLPGTDSMFGDPMRNIMWSLETTTEITAFGHFRLPSDDAAVYGYSVNNPTFLHPNGGHNWTHKQLDSLMHLTSWDLAGADPAVGDKGLLLHTNGITLAPGEKYLDEYVVFGWDNTSGVDIRNNADRRSLMKVWLRQNGFYRGDVNTDNRGHERSTANVDLGAAPNGGGINVVDIVYLANWVLKGTARPWPFDDQGDVNGDGVVTLVDVISLANYVFKGTNVPVDKNRFLPTSYQALFSRSSLWQNPTWNNTTW